jgi:hypothetical protein
MSSLGIAYFWCIGDGFQERGVNLTAAAMHTQNMDAFSATYISTHQIVVLCYQFQKLANMDG